MRLLLLALASCALSGCQMICQHIDEIEFQKKACWEARRVWKSVDDVYKNCEPQPKHFGKGFKEGYVSVLSGGDGCQPVLPPSCYWSTWYQTRTGQEKTLAWFNGFSAGASFALKSNRPSREIMTAPTMTACEPAAIEFPGSMAREPSVAAPPMPAAATPTPGLLDLPLPNGGGFNSPQPIYNPGASEL